METDKNNIKTIVEPSVTDFSSKKELMALDVEEPINKNKPWRKIVRRIVSNGRSDYENLLQR